MATDEKTKALGLNFFGGAADTLLRNWWVVALRGVFALLFGVMALRAPASSLVFIVFVFASFSLVDGLSALFAGVRAARRGNSWGTLVAEGVVGIAIAAITFFWPAITLMAFVFLVGFWSLLRGMLEITAAVRLRKEIKGEWLLALGGALSIAFGFLVVARPFAGLLGLAWLVGFYALVFGAMQIALGFRLRSARKALAARADALPGSV